MLLKYGGTSAALSFLISGCASTFSSSFKIHEADITKLKSFYVIKHEDDDRNTNVLIKDKLVKMGYKASTGQRANVPNDVDAVITYRDHWFWDITMFMLWLKVHIRTPQDGFPMARGESFRTSFARKSPEEMVNEVLEQLFKENLHKRAATQIR